MPLQTLKHLLVPSAFAAASVSLLMPSFSLAMPPDPEQPPLVPQTTPPGEPEAAPPLAPPVNQPERLHPDLPHHALPPRTRTDGRQRYRDENPFENKLFAMPLPPDLSREQRQIALRLMQEARPRLSRLHDQLCTTLKELHNISFAADTPPDALIALGRQLVQIRGAILQEMQRLSLLVEKEAHFNPNWGNPDVCRTPLDTPPCQPID